ncbi:hypothetical protein B6U81_07290 [Thermoplasmatales archaeon ex4484_30]|nr:MAG: hypothetical protein B6U81_07290 [Thermoplasmatales archaeon ex4484_30]
MSSNLNLPVSRLKRDIGKAYAVMNDKTFPLGGIVMDKVEKEFGLFSKIFDGIGRNMKDFVLLVKVHVNNTEFSKITCKKIHHEYNFYREFWKSLK